MSDEAATLLQSKKSEERQRAVRLLRRQGGADAAWMLLKALQDRTSYVAALAAEALGEIGEDGIADAMLERFFFLAQDGVKRDPGCHIRANLAFAFAKMDYRPARDALHLGIRTRQMESGTDTAVHLRGNCALALAHLGVRDAIRDIGLLLFDRSENRIGAEIRARTSTIEARKAAAQALGSLGDPFGAALLAVKLTFPEDEAPEVLQECMQALIALEDDRTVELLQPYLAVRDRHLAAFAAVMLAQTRAPEATDLLRHAIPNFTGDPLRAVILALTSLRTDEAEALLRELAADARPEVRKQIEELALHLKAPNSERS
jgi:HEAT repeat protein